ncbi:hypothetical protein [Fibrobacter sp. UWB12]|uniref:hypothetical protein n=1 Tax=Fibrobacter sp. UWB12 TaxID=1896203 RepID=UPI00092276EC|nr:hypothetical protein [Fibrobacter sp. UWB12]SHK26615.1 hypothetical protein SAMN05720759_101421 [Fibrobacter sp. UWB12]
MRVYFFPSCPREGYINPYCLNYKKSLSKYFDVEEQDNCVTRMKALTLFKFSWLSDVFVLNWIENATKWRFGIIQFVLVILSLCIIKIRKKKIVWMLHNLQPHEGVDYGSRFTMNFLYKYANLIVSHSNDAALVAREKAHCRVEYICHPITSIEKVSYEGRLFPCDILIWGSILPYKGVAEFLQVFREKKCSLNVVVLGKCSSESLNSQLLSLVGNNIVYENRFADFSEIHAYIQNSKYVLFPYIGDCVSSSGALIDSIAMGGLPVGPRKGAFRDLEKEGVCVTYSDYEELFNILQSNHPQNNVVEFLKNNSWENFSAVLKQLLL